MYKVHSRKTFEQISHIETTNLSSDFFEKIFFTISDAFHGVQFYSIDKYNVALLPTSK